MARPQRNNVDYFPFYCEDGKKMYYLEETYGNDGFATFMKLLRELAKSDFHYLDLSKNTTTMFLSARCKVSKETLESIINDLVELEKFDSMLWSENRIIWCQDFVDSIQDAYSKRSNDCITYNGLLLLLQGLGVRKPIKQPSTEPVKPQSIVEYNKSDETKEEQKEKLVSAKDRIPTIDSFISYGLEKASANKLNVSESSLRMKYEAWRESGWVNGNGQEIRNWKSSLLNTLPHIKEKPNPQAEAQKLTPYKIQPPSY